MKQAYDVVIVGSGAAGGTLAAHLVRRGMTVAVVEGGPPIDTAADFNGHAMPFDYENRLIPLMSEGKRAFTGERTQGVGGKTMLWNAVALRYSERDFKGRTFEGAGEDWPFGYAEMKPYYDLIEREVGLCGTADGLEDLPDGIFQPPPPFKCTDLAIKRSADKLGLPFIHVRKATLTRVHAGRPPCHYCGACMDGCDVAAKYNSYDGHMKPALASRRLTVIPNTVVSEVVLGANNRVSGVRYIARETRVRGEIDARCVVVSGGCVQSVALLMMSKSAQYPAGIANSSGLLGRNFIPHFTGSFEFFLREMIGKPPVNDEGFLDHALMPSFMHGRRRSYARSFQMQLNFQSHKLISWPRLLPGFGAAFKEAVKARYPAFVTLLPFGEKLPDARTFISLSATKADEFGLPEAQRHVNWSKNDQALFADMNAWAKRIIAGADGDLLSEPTEPQTNHEMGGCSMGIDPRHSVVDSFCRTHDVQNLYVVDGSVFPSSSEKNPTLTIMALAARTAEEIARRFNVREL